MGKTPSPKETLEYLYSLQSAGIKPGLARIDALLSALGSPQDSFASVHIAGTNGKGSTAAMIEAVLLRAGFRTGLYTSPHLVRFNERIRVSGRPVTDRTIVDSARAARKALSGLTGKVSRPSFFEFTTAMAFLVFKQKKTQIAVLETGMGGMWDATNTVTPLVSVITNVSLEHGEHLGSTTAEIAAQKAGIIKPGVPVVTTEAKRAPLSAIRAAARKAASPLYVIGRDFDIEQSGDRPYYTGIQKDYANISLGLKGDFQHRNAAAALAALELLSQQGYHVGARAIRQGLARPDWPARLEVVSRRPLVLLDAAHNPAGAEALANTLGRMSFKNLILVAGVMADKDIAGVLRPLARRAGTIILARPGMDRAAPTRLLRENLKGFNGQIIEAASVKSACSEALRLARASDAVCVTGSIFTVGEARGALARKLRRPRASS